MKCTEVEEKANKDRNVLLMRVWGETFLSVRARRETHECALRLHWFIRFRSVVFVLSQQVSAILCDLLEELR